MDEMKITDPYPLEPKHKDDNSEQVQLFNKWFKTDLAKLFASNVVEVHDYDVNIAEDEKVYLYIESALNKKTLTSLIQLDGFYSLDSSDPGLFLSFALNKAFYPEYRCYRESVEKKFKAIQEERKNVIWVCNIDPRHKWEQKVISPHKNKRGYFNHSDKN